MRLRHRILASRFQRDYLTGVFRGIGRTRYYTRMLRLPVWKQPLYAPLYFLNDLRKYVRHRWQTRAASPDDVVVAAEREVFAGAVASPYFHWKAKLLGDS